MSRFRGFQVDWYSGASAQLELFAPKARVRRGPGNYQLKYTPPFRSTIRPPIENRPLGSQELDPIGRSLDKFATDLSSRAVRPMAGMQPAGIDDSSSSESDMKRLGNQLLDLLIPRNIQVDLRNRGLFLEVGMDEGLLDYPWELMHDGDDFLCLKHYVGRFVNASENSIPPAVPPRDWLNSKLENLSVLVVSVPSPEPRDDTEYEQLPGAEAETEAISKTLDGLRKRGVKYNLIKDRNATFDNVWSALRDDYQIIHFIGHATYNDKDPFRSGLVLYNQDMTSGQVASFFSKKPPVLCFMNACETGRTGSLGTRAWKSTQNIFGLARAFLTTGTYLLGSRWKLGDKAAAIFATKFYSLLLGNEKPIGDAITEARKACKETSPEDPFSWASYIFYGDPRLYFRRAQTARE